MGQLIRATVIPLKTIHYSQPGRLVSSDSIDIERRKAIARHNAMRTNYSASTGANDYRYIQQINQAFSSKQTSIQASSKAASSNAAFQQTANVSAHAKTPAPIPTVQQGESVENMPYTNSESSYVPVSGVSESQAAYTLQRGSFELRVAKGELSYLPPLDMTIIIQYPSVEFEYISDFNYIPPRDDESLGETIDFTT